jgi:hypothetical protein
MEEENNVVIEDNIIVAIAQIPQEHWGNLLQMIKLFQDSVNPKPKKAIDPLHLFGIILVSKAARSILISS